jgi:TRAP transporter TAXI family solute receptor
MIAGLERCVGCQTCMAACRHANPDWPKSLFIGTSAPGGVYYIYGEALAQLLTEKLGIATNFTASHGSVHNVELIERGDAQLGTFLMGGWNGAGGWTHERLFQTIRALVPMYETPFHTVALRRSSITTLAQLNKKRIGPGPRASLTAAYAQRIFAALGISAKMRYASFDTQAGELLEGDIDAMFVAIAAPAPAIQKVEAKEPITLISLSPEQIDIILKANPELNASKIAAGVYRSLDRDYDTVGVYNFVVGRADLPDDLVYQLVKAVFENQPRLVKATSAASETIPQNASKNTFLPFHPGAVRYYREIGIKIPDALIPTH